MPSNRTIYEYVIWILIWIGLSAVSWYLIYLKFIGLDFHTRDYAFYTEFILKWSKPVSQHYYSINPGGYNFLGVSAADGCDGFYQWIHFEPLRFVQAFIFKITNSLQAVFIFNSLLVCSPVLAIPIWLRKTSAGWLEKLVWVIFFVAFPATLLTAGYDNRPSMFLGVGFFWILFSHLATKIKWLRMASFLILFTIREEALILNGVVCLFVFFQFNKKETSLKQFLFYTASLGLYAITLFTYYRYFSTSLFQKQSFSYSFHLMGILFLLCLGWMYYMFVKKKYQQILFLPIVFFLFQVVVMYYSGMLPDAGYNFFNDPRNSFWFVVLFALLLFVRSNHVKGVSLIVGMLAIFFLIVPLLYGDHVLARIRNEKVRVNENQILLNVKTQITDQDTIITDYYTHQAYIDQHHVFCFQRLPCTMNTTASRFFPGNIDMLKTLFKKGTWIFIHGSSFEMLEEAGFVNESFIQEKNEKYFILRVKANL